MFDWDNVSEYCWWDGMPAVLVREGEVVSAFSIAEPGEDWREVNAVEVFHEARRLSQSSFQSRLEAFMALE